jgi:hypothetical protein
MLTIALVGATATSVLVARQLAEHARTTNEQAARNAHLAVQMAAPVLTIIKGPVLHGPGIDGSANASVMMSVRNSGGGVAMELKLVSDWQDTIAFETAVGSSDANVELRLWMTSVPQGITHAPHPVAWEFTDLAGIRYRQPVGGRPTPTSGEA